jgi:hypothetical protein
MSWFFYALPITITHQLPSFHKTNFTTMLPLHHNHHIDQTPWMLQPPLYDRIMKHTIHCHYHHIYFHIKGCIGGNNAHASNIVTALYLATGQDPAQNGIVTFRMIHRLFVNYLGFLVTGS